MTRYIIRLHWKLFMNQANTNSVYESESIDKKINIRNWI